MTITRRSRIVAGSVAVAASLTFVLPAASAFAAPPKPVTPQSQVQDTVNKLKTVDFQAFLKAVEKDSDDEGQATAAGKMLTAYSKLSDDQKLVANAVNVTQLAAKKYGADSPEAKASEAAVFGLKLTDSLIRVAGDIINGGEFNATQPGSGKKPSSAALISEATFNPAREDDPVWIEDEDGPSPTDPAFKVTQDTDKDKPGKPDKDKTETSTGTNTDPNQNSDTGSEDDGETTEA